MRPAMRIRSIENRINTGNGATQPGLYCVRGSSRWTRRKSDQSGIAPATGATNAILFSDSQRLWRICRAELSNRTGVAVVSLTRQITAPTGFVLAEEGRQATLFRVRTTYGGIHVR